MALSDIILNKGEVIVILANSSLGIAPAGQAINFGIVQAINDLCDTTSVGSSVWFDVGKAIPFMIISGQIFYRLKESDIAASESYVPPP